MNDDNEKKFEKMLHDIINDDCTGYTEESLVQLLLSDLEYVRQKFLQFQADMLENTIIGEQLCPAIWDFADYCAGIEAILQEDYKEFEGPEKGKLWRKIILSQASKVINGSHNE